MHAMMKWPGVSERPMPVMAVRLETVATRPSTGSGTPSLRLRAGSRNTEARVWSTVTLVVTLVYSDSVHWNIRRVKR